MLSLLRVREPGGQDPAPRKVDMGTPLLNHFAFCSSSEFRALKRSPAGKAVGPSAEVYRVRSSGTRDGMSEARDSLAGFHRLRRRARLCLISIRIGAVRRWMPLSLYVYPDFRPDCQRLLLRVAVSLNAPRGCHHRRIAKPCGAFRRRTRGMPISWLLPSLRRSRTALALSAMDTTIDRRQLR